MDTGYFVTMDNLLTEMIEGCQKDPSGMTSAAGVSDWKDIDAAIDEARKISANEIGALGNQSVVAAPSLHGCKTLMI